MVSFLFGKKRRYRKSNRSACSALRSKKKCSTSAMCSWRKGKGCKRKSVKKSAPDHHISGDDDLGAYAAAAGIEFFGRRRGRRRGRRGTRRSTRRSTRRKVRRVRRHRKVRRVRRRVHRRSTAVGALIKRAAAFGAAASMLEYKKMEFGRRRRRRFGGGGCGKFMKRDASGMCVYKKLKRSSKMFRRRSSQAFGRRRPYKFPKSRKIKRRRKIKHRKSHRKTPKKLPAKIRKMCKRLKIKCTKKVGSRRVYKKMSVIRKQIARRMRSMRRRHRR